MKSLGVIVLLACTSACLAQKKHVAEYAAQIRETNKLPNTADLTNRRVADNVLAAIRMLIADSSAQMRFNAYAHLAHFRMPAIDADSKERCVETLVQACSDTDANINSLAISLLQSFRKSDFSAAAKDKLVAQLKTFPPYYDQLVKLIGYVDIPSARDVLRLHLQSRRVANTQSVWAARVALSRMGDQPSLDYVMTRIASIQVNDIVIDEIFPDLLYTRQKRAIDYVIAQALRDDLACESPSPAFAESVPCDTKIVALLATAISDFPLKADAIGSVSLDDYSTMVASCKEWLKEGGWSVDVERY